MSDSADLNEIATTESIKIIETDKKDCDEGEYLVNFEHKFRTALPKSMVDRSASSIWAILKQCVDKELYRFSLPIMWNEPLSLLQRACENANYSDELLNKASKMSDACERMKMVAAFVVSSTSIHVHRLSKPFNPLLGETYEYTSDESKFRMVCEQVSHHPPISAYYAESIRPTQNENKVRWAYHGSINPFMKINFLHACIEAYPEGIQTVELPEHDEVYTWHNLKVTAHNIVLGKMWFEQTGRIEIINHKLNIKCVMDFKPYSWFSRSLNRVEGYILDKNDKKIALLNGKWDEFFYATNNVTKSSEFFKRTESLQDSSKFKKSSSTSSLNEKDITLLWKGDVSQAEQNLFNQFYNFSKFTLGLNELYPGLEKPVKILTKEEGLSKSVSLGPIPPTDSRYRPDLRHFDDGDFNKATDEKHRVEEKQREKRQKNSNFQANWQPLWFDKKQHDSATDEETFTFNHKYWKRDFSKCPHLY